MRAPMPTLSSRLALLPTLAVALTSLGAAGCGAELDEDTATSEAANTAKTTTDLRFAAFIPCEGVDQMGLFDGDGRSFDHDGAARSSRLLLDVKIDPNGPDTVTPKGFPSKKFSGSALASKSGWCAKLKPGAVAEKEATASLDRVTASVREKARTWQGGSVTYDVTEVQLDAHGKNPLVFFAPNADGVCSLDVYYPRGTTSKAPKWIVWACSHDAFPSWELYIDKQRVLAYDVLAAGGGPFDLIPGNEERAQGVCESVNGRWDCQAE